MNKQIGLAIAFLLGCVSGFLVGAAVVFFFMRGNNSPSTNPRVEAPNSAIVGRWELLTQGVSSEFFNSGPMSQIEFLEDGTFIMPKWNNNSGKYSFPTSDRITLVGPQPYGAVTYKFKVSGNTLTINEYLFERVE
ncbi:MAG TPA: hypothetical protein VFD70_24900 [Anaerolineae bacterium]|nr:hypothetical protein [Anaerolineae bacterium]